MEANDPVYLDSRAICQRFLISTTTLWRLQKKGLLCPRYLPGGQRRYRLEDVLAFEREHLAAEVKP